MAMRNFGRNVTITPGVIETPADEAEVLAILGRYHGRRIRCVGRLHSWSRLIDSPDVLLDLSRLNEVRVDATGDDQLVHVGAGCQIKRLLAELESHCGWTLPSVGFITEQTIGGAIATGTHGSGRHSLSHYVVEARVARYDESTGQAVIERVAQGDALRAIRCSLGCLGVIVSVTMRCRHQYDVEERFEEYATVEQVLAAETDYPLQQFYLVPWRWTLIAQHRRETLLRRSKAVAVYHWYRFLTFDVAMHLLLLFAIRFPGSRAIIKGLFRWIIPAAVIRNWSVVGVSSQQLVMEHELFRHVEIELFVRRSQLEAALQFVQDSLIAAADHRAGPSVEFMTRLAAADCGTELLGLMGSYCHHYPICVRRILPDDTLISMASGHTERNGPDPGCEETSCETECWYSITLTNYHRGEAREPFERLARFLAISMARLFGARPHWGKLCPLTVDELRQLYPAFERFRSLHAEHDPDRVFGNSWTDALLDQPAARSACLPDSASE